MSVAPVPWGGRRVPMTLLGGYLGAGKTTVVNAALRQADTRIAVLVNDVGSVAVDAALIAARHEDTIELTNGCVCCSLVDGFAMALETLRRRPVPPDHVLVELSGVAEPGRVTAWAATAGFVLDGVVVVADADQVADRSVDPRLRSLVAAQLSAADLVLVTKLDLVDDRSPVDRLLDELSRAPRLDVVDGDVPVAVLLGPRPLGRPQPAAVTSDGTSVHRVATVEVPVVAAARLRRMLDELPGDVVRVKGVALTSEGPMVVQRVGPRTRITPASGGTEGLVVVALDPDTLAAALERLRAG